jgi:hypothetical protein
VSASAVPRYAGSAPLPGSGNRLDGQPLDTPRRPSGHVDAEGKATAHEGGETRAAQPNDIAMAQGISKGAKRYWGNHLVRYRNSCTNLAWPKRATAAKDLFVSERSIKSYRRELLEGNWICFPEGDAGGGLAKGLVIHLHPDGKPCQLPRVALKQRTVEANIRRAAANRARAWKEEDSSPLEQSSKGEGFSPLRGKKTAVEGEENDRALIMKESSIEPLMGNLQQQQGVGAFAEKSETAVVDVAHPCEIIISRAVELITDRWQSTLRDFANPIFDDIRRMCYPAVSLDGKGRTRIYQASHRFGFTLNQLRYAWRRDGRYQTGGVIALAEEWNASTAHISEWPRCYACEDTGKPFRMAKVIPRHVPGDRSVGLNDKREDMFWDSAGSKFCSCPAGVVTATAAATAAKSDKATANTSPEPDRSAEAGKAREHDEAVSNNHEDLRLRHICPMCEGCQSNVNGSKCSTCNGTGGYYSTGEFAAMDHCHVCCGVGTRRTDGTKPCKQCQGSKTFYPWSKP